MSGALHGLLASARPLGSLGCNFEAPARNSAVCGLLTSLERNGKFVLKDALDSAGQAAMNSPKSVDAVLMCIPIVMWLRGPDERIALATARLAQAMGFDTITGMSAVFAGQWLRRLFSRKDIDAAWDDALASMPTITALFRTSTEAWELTRMVLNGNSSSMMHPVSQSLRQVKDAARKPTLIEMYEFLRINSADSSTLSMAATVGGMAYGHEQVIDIWPEEVLSREEASWVRAIGHRAQKMYRLERWPPETSETHPLPIASIPTQSGLKLSVSPGPGRDDPVSPQFPVQRTMSLDVETIAAWGARHVVCLVEPDVLLDFGMSDLGPAIREKGIAFWYLPPGQGDDDPNYKQERIRLFASLRKAFERGEPVLVHCLDFEEPAVDFAARLLYESGQAQDIDEATRSISLAIEVAKIGFSRHDQDD